MDFCFADWVHGLMGGIEMDMERIRYTYSTLSIAIIC